MFLSLVVFVSRVHDTSSYNDLGGTNSLPGAGADQNFLSKNFLSAIPNLSCQIHSIQHGDHSYQFSCNLENLHFLMTQAHVIILVRFSC